MRQTHRGQRGNRAGSLPPSQNVVCTHIFPLRGLDALQSSFHLRVLLSHKYAVAQIRHSAKHAATSTASMVFGGCQRGCPQKIPRKHPSGPMAGVAKHFDYLVIGAGSGASTCSSIIFMAAACVGTVKHVLKCVHDCETGRDEYRRNFVRKARGRLRCKSGSD
jgi:hypothetical protein